MAADPLLFRYPLEGDALAGAGDTAPQPHPAPALARLRAVLPDEVAAMVSNGTELSAPSGMMIKCLALRLLATGSRRIW